MKTKLFADELRYRGRSDDEAIEWYLHHANVRWNEGNEELAWTLFCCAILAERGRKT